MGPVLSVPLVMDAVCICGMFFVVENSVLLSGSRFYSVDLHVGFYNVLFFLVHVGGLLEY